MPPRARIRHLPAVASMLLAFACSKATDEAPKTRDRLTATEAAALAALPYASWTSDADPEVRGIVTHDPDRAWPGINLYTNSTEAFLMDMEGHRLHTWRMPEGYGRCDYFELLDDGDIVVICVGHGLLRLDWRSRVVWAVDLDAHHDVHVQADGSFLVPYREPLRRYRRRRVYFDAIAHISAAGELLDSWSTFDHLAELQRLHNLSFLDTPGPWWRYFRRTTSDYYHLNSIEILGESPLGESDARFQPGNWLICLRNADLIAILDRDGRQVVWSWGPNEIRKPHMPTQLENGDILLYDNQGKETYTRLLEVDPLSGEIVWQYTADPPESFYSAWGGCNQRLPNGNTLISDGSEGRVFEVTRDGEIVWDFWNPELQDGKRRTIYRLIRISEEYVRSVAEGARQRLRGVGSPP